NLEIIAKGRIFPKIKEGIQMVITFHLAVFAWIFFRAESVSHAFSYVKNMLSPSLFSFPSLNKAALATLVLIGFLVVVEWLGRENNYGIEKTFLKQPRILRWSFYGFIILLIGLFMQTQESPFIYFQF